MPKYYVELEGGNATIVEAKRKATARNYARREFGNYLFAFIRLATQEEINWNAAMGGIVHNAMPETVETR
jgi:hypothetical protein